MGPQVSASGVSRSTAKRSMLPLGKILLCLCQSADFVLTRDTCVGGESETEREVRQYSVPANLEPRSAPPSTDCSRRPRNARPRHRYGSNSMNCNTDAGE